MIAAVAVLYALFIIGRVLIFGIDTPGYASLLIAVLLHGRHPALSIGIIGEYLGRLFLEVKGRPIYVVEGVYEEAAAARPDGPQGRGHPRQPTSAGTGTTSPRPPRLRRMVGGLRPQRLLDVGAGSGFFSRHLLAEAGAQSALCVDVGYERDRDETRRPASRCSTAATAAPTDCDLVLMMDVLEHVDDDRGLVRHYADQGAVGRAFPGDRARPSASCGAATTSSSSTSGATRWPRSSRPCATAGLEVVRGAYYFGVVFPLAAAVRLATRNDPTPRSSLKKHGALTNGLLAAACAAGAPAVPDQPPRRPVSLRAGEEALTSSPVVRGGREG